jgi:MOSC domain-containing protein YiiM
MMAAGLLVAARVLQINISRGGVPKRPITEGILTPLGFQGDAWSNPRLHGGPRQAVLLIARETVDELAARGYPVFYGALGENITTDGLDRRSLRVGQRYRIGSEAIIELTQPRAPCRTLDRYGSDLKSEIWDKILKEGNPASPRWGLSGFYASVLASGLILPGAPILLLDQRV